MNNRKYLQTKFINFLLERYKDNSDLNNEEDLPFLQRKTLEPIDIPIEDGDEDEVQDEDEIIDELLTEYRKLQIQYESKVEFRCN